MNILDNKCNKIDIDNPKKEFCALTLISFKS